jgi:hypothetical protein
LYIFPPTVYITHMTGSRLCLRRYSGCNLHWYAPGTRINSAHQRRNYYDPPPRWLRYRLYTTTDNYIPDSPRYGWDKHGVYIWVWPDCGWEWLAGRPLIRSTPLYTLFTRLHDHVHTPHRKTGRLNIWSLPLLRKLRAG